MSDPDIAARLDRIESQLAIQQLPIRYALAIDGRDIDAWLALFIPDVDCGTLGSGREALRAFIEPGVRTFYRSVHQICGHAVDFVDPDHATGRVYCRAEHEDRGGWYVMAICYFDDYERRDGAWMFTRRRERHWYAADLLERPTAPFTGWPGHERSVPRLPAAFPSWSRFWREVPDEQIGALTAMRVESAQ
ncbi:nuclear transport factor 2 family protein [Sphingomonas sp. 2378]|uniref:nuclear transport factor 2 family protein n=1 Tax=Sphingomonas sp. 2378 TaxID=1219748 RepID=UPI00311ADDA6